MLDIVLLAIDFSLPEQIIDRFIVLRTFSTPRQACGSYSQSPGIAPPLCTPSPWISSRHQSGIAGAPPGESYPRSTGTDRKQDSEPTPKWKWDPTHRATFHRKTFTRTSLTIRKDSHIITICHTLHKLRNLVEYFNLSGLRFKYL